MKLTKLFFLFLLSANNLFGQQGTEAAKPSYSAEVFFAFAKHDLRPEADSLLTQLLNYTKSKENFTIRITAHTDSIGSLANNQALSERRAQAVKDFLVKNGVPAERIRFEFFGEKQPATSNDSEANRQRNRRATVDVLLARSMVVVEGTVTDEKTGLPLVADVIFRSKDFNDSLRTGADGRFRKEVPAGTVLGLDAFAHCHFMGTSMVKAMPKLPHVTLPLKPVEQGAKIDIDNLYFVGNQPVLLENSKPELPKILRFMQANPSMKIEIAGHVNRPNHPPVGKDSWDFKLSEDRAKVVYTYLVENGIPTDRVTWKGYGNHEMRYPRSNDEREQALNRRVELRVLEGECGD